MTANEMFKKLGYEKDEYPIEEKRIVYYKTVAKYLKSSIPYGDTEIYDTFDINFDRKKVSIEKLSGNGDLTFEEAKAVAKAIEEMEEN